MSRHDLLARCERAVFWRYFGSRGLGLIGTELTGAADLQEARLAALRDARRAWALRNLTDLPLLVGTVVHNAARLVLDAVIKGEPLPAYEALLAGARYTLNQAWRSSQPDQIEMFWRYPGVFSALREVVYRERLTDAEIALANARVRDSLRSLLSARVLTDIGACDHGEVWLPEHSGPIPFEPTTGQTAWAAVDFAYRHYDVAAVARGLAEQAAAQPFEDLQVWRRGAAASAAAEAAARRAPSGPTWCVADWKTAARPDPESESLQLAAYALWLAQAGYPLTDGVFLGRIIDLVKGADRWYVLDGESLESARAVILADMEKQRSLMADPDRALPLPRANWALASQPQRTCPSCRFYALCRDELLPLRVRINAEKNRANVAHNSSRPRSSNEAGA